MLLIGHNAHSFVNYYHNVLLFSNKKILHPHGTKDRVTTQFHLHVTIQISVGTPDKP